MRSRDPKNVFIEEIAEIDNTHENDIIEDRVESSDAGKDVPVLFIDLSSFHKVEKVGENVVLVGFLFSSPFVALHLEFLDKDVTTQDTQSVANKDIQNDRVPPAFSEVGEPVLEGEFEKFEKDTQEHAEFPISNNQHFEEPSKEMSRNKHIHSTSEICEFVW